MSKGQKLRALVNERLTAAAEEIFELFERTIAEYEEEVHTLKQRNNTQQQLLDQVLEPRVLLHRTGVQFVSVKSEDELGPSLEPPHIKEEPEEEQLQEFSFIPVSVKTEDDEDKSSVLHQRPTEENREETAAEGQQWNPVGIKESKRGPRSKCRRGCEAKSSLEPKPYRCSECGKRFLRKADLQRHELIHTGQKPFKCPFCEKGFIQKVHLKQHVVTHTGDRPFKCLLCDRAFSRAFYLKEHIHFHTGERPFSCSVCKKGFIAKRFLLEHMKTHTINKQDTQEFTQQQQDFGSSQG